MKLHFILPLSILLLCSCNEQRKQNVPNFFKHGMKGEVESVYTHSYRIIHGKKEECPRGYIFLWGDKFCDDCSHQLYDRDGNIIQHTTYIDWATFTDSFIVTYNYHEGRLLSTTKTTYSRQYSPPSTSFFEYTEDGVLYQWDGKTFKTNEDKQICEMDESFEIYTLKIQRKTLYNNQGVMTRLYDMTTNKLSISNTFDNDGNIVQQEEYFENSPTPRKDTIVYSQFDEFGNWTQRKRIDASREDTTIQCREIHYYQK